jgi:hypothetical protein
MKTLEHRFVEEMPTTLDEGVLYISMRFRTALHKCVCGCGYEVVTPFSPTDWQLTFDGESVSLSPSIGSWEFACRSHYFITNNKVVHAGDWDDWEVEKGRKRDRERKQKYYGGATTAPVEKPKINPIFNLPQSRMSRLKALFLSLFNN